MKKFWKIRVDNFFKESLVFLGVDDEYINILMDNSCAIMEYVYEHPSDYIYISYNSNDISYNKFGWDEIEHYDNYIKEKYEFCGIVNLRKDKLKKLNELYKSTI